jgi:molybdenum cofactor cytidylyltransferase
MGPEISAAMVLMGDEPGIRPESILAVLDASERTKAPVVRATYGGRPGHPVLLRRAVWAPLLEGSGDVGAREWMAKNAHLVDTVDLPFSAPIEVDTKKDYQRLLDSE